MANTEFNAIRIAASEFLECLKQSVDYEKLQEFVNANAFLLASISIEQIAAANQFAVVDLAKTLGALAPQNVVSFPNYSAASEWAHKNSKQAMVMCMEICPDSKLCVMTIQRFNKTENRVELCFYVPVA